MTKKFDDFIAELKQLCTRHCVTINAEAYDRLQVWDADEVEPEEFQDRTEHVQRAEPMFAGTAIAMNGTQIQARAIEWLWDQLTIDERWLRVDTDEPLPTEGVHALRITLPRGQVYVGTGHAEIDDEGRQRFRVIEKFVKLEPTS